VTPHPHRLARRLRDWRPSRSGIRQAVTLTATVLMFLITTTQVASAATPGAPAGAGGMLGPFNVTGSDGYPLNHYNLVSNPGGVTDFQSEAQSYMMSGLFALVRVMVGLECWLIHWAYTFPFVAAVAARAQQLSDAYKTDVIGPLQLPGMLLAWAVVVCGVMLMRGKPGRAFGELALTFTIVAVATAGLLRPDVILGRGGLLDQTHQAGLQVAAITTDHGAPPPAGVAPDDISAPLQTTLTSTFVVQPYQLLQFGRLITTGDPAYAAYRAAIAAGPYNTDAHADGGPASCSGLWGPGLKVCQDADQGNNRSYTDLSNAFSKVDPTIAAYVQPPSWDRVIGALLLLGAALVVGALVLSMVLAMFAAQFADAALACCAYPALVWAIMPGPSRAVLWRWIGSFVSSALVMFAAAVFLPLFGVAVGAFLQGAGEDLVTRLAMVDLLALAALGFHRRLMAGAGAAGARLANRLRWARIGGSGSGDDATRTGQVIAGALSQGGSYSGATGLYGGAFAAGSPAHAHLLRRARVLSGVHALGDIPGAPLHPGRLLGDIRREAAHGLAPLTVAARGARHLWLGRELSPEEFERRRIKPGMGGGMPVGSRLHNRLIQTRGGRTLLTTGRIAWAATPVGGAATWTRTRRRADAVRRDARSQYQHYKLEGLNYWNTEVAPGARDLSAPARAVGRAVIRADHGVRLAAAASTATTSRTTPPPPPTFPPRPATPAPAPAATSPGGPTAGAGTLWLEWDPVKGGFKGRDPKPPPPPASSPPPAPRSRSGTVVPPHGQSIGTAIPGTGRENFIQALHRARREARERGDQS